MIALALALALAAGPGEAAVPPPATRAASKDDARRARIANELLRLAATLQKELEAGDARALLARVPAAGLRCGGQVVPKPRVARDLGDPGSWLHRVLFGPPGDRKGHPASLRAFLAAAPEVAVFVTFRRDEQAGPLGLPCFEYRARDLETPGAPLCFDRAGGRWWFAESLYPCL